LSGERKISRTDLPSPAVPKKSVSFRLTLGADDRTLTADEVTRTASDWSKDSNLPATNWLGIIEPLTKPIRKLASANLSGAPSASPETTPAHQFQFHQY